MRKEHTRKQIRSRLAFIEAQAKQAQRTKVEEEVFLDLIDNIDSEVQQVIRIANLARRPDQPAESKTYSVTVTFTVGEDSDCQLQDETSIRSEVSSWLESLRASIVDVDVQKHT